MSKLAVIEVLQEVEKAGIELSLVPPTGIGCKPAANLTDSLRTLIRDHKPALIEWLAHQLVPDDLPKPLPPDVLVAEYRLYTKLQPTPPANPKGPAETATDAEPPEDPGAWRELAQAYHLHHFGCHQCQAASRGAVYGLRCGVGAALWQGYQENAIAARSGMAKAAR